jgi:hypothetical protein
MQTFYKKYHNKSVEDGISVMSKEAKSFVTAFRNMLKRELSPYGIEVLSLKPNHYDCSGFVKKDDKYVYIHYSIPRYGTYINFKNASFQNGVLIRLADNDHDFKGYDNHFSSIYDLPTSIRRLLES